MLTKEGKSYLLLTYLYHYPSSIVVLEDLCFQEHKSRIRRKHEEYTDEVTEDRVLRHSYKRGPPDRPNRPTGPWHRHNNIRTHKAETRRKTVAKGAKVGPAEPMVRPNLPWLPSRWREGGADPPEGGSQCFHV